MRTTILILACFCSVIISTSQAKAELTLDVTRGVVEPVAIAIPDFQSKSAQYAELANKIPNVIRQNLTNSGLFKALARDTFIQSRQSLHNDGPRFPEWRAINTQALVTGKVKQNANGKVRVEFRLFDVFGQKQLTGMAYTAKRANWRRIAHLISDDVYKRITGEEGYFDSRIIYVAESGSGKNTTKRLAIMDQDGHNHRYLTSGERLVLTPRFSPNSHKVTYLAYDDRKPRVYIYDLRTGEQRLLGDFPSMTFAPRFSPDGDKVIMSLARHGNSEIYTMDLDSGDTKRLTQNGAIDTSPGYSPSGERIVFESDRGGSQQLYVMKADGSNPHRITFGDGRYANPVWSPRGDHIAFTRIHDGKFYIGVIKPDGSGERLITSAYHVEGPTWSPNGRYLAYFKQKPTGPRGMQRKSRLYAIDITGYHKRKIPTPGNASDPSWSPLNP
jgi:TolB protein